MIKNVLSDIKQFIFTSKTIDVCKYFTQKGVQVQCHEILKLLLFYSYLISPCFLIYKKKIASNVFRISLVINSFKILYQCKLWFTTWWADPLSRLPGPRVLSTSGWGPAAGQTGVPVTGDMGWVTANLVVSKHCGTKLVR